MRSPGRFLLGAVLIGLGVLALLDAGGVVDGGRVVSHWWPLVFIALGAVQFVTDRGSRGGPLVLIAIGVVLLGSTLDLWDSNVWRYLWPIALVAVGLSIVIGTPRDGSSNRSDDLDEVRAIVALSRRETRSTSAMFRGGSVTVVLGAFELDLTGSTLDPNAVLELTVVLGGVDIVVPEGWNVAIGGTPVLAGWDDTTRRDVIRPGSPRLVIRALAVLGGVEVRHPQRWG